jgi:hypothetical protein
MGRTLFDRASEALDSIEIGKTLDIPTVMESNAREVLKKLTEWGYNYSVVRQGYDEDNYFLHLKKLGDRKDA